MNEYLSFAFDWTLSHSEFRDSIRGMIHDAWKWVVKNYRNIERRRHVGIMGEVIELGKITDEIILSWVEKYEKKGDFYYCKECGSRIMCVTCYTSIHIKEFEPLHSGPGRVLTINYPCCPKCDGKIDYAKACYHMSMKEGLWEKIP